MLQRALHLLARITFMLSNGTQRIAKIRRDYNRWVADETLEDYALRFTPK